MWKCYIDKMKHWNKSAIADVYTLKHSLMDKKEYVLKLLDSFKDSMPLARWLMVLIKDSNVDEKLIDVLIQSFKDSLKDMKDGELKDKLEKWKDFLEEMQRREADSKKLDEEDIKHLDELMANM